MARNYPDELGEWVKRREVDRPRQDKHAVAFLAVKSNVEAALDAGYAMKTVWEHLQAMGRLQYRYETFTHHVRRYIKVSPAASASLAAPTTRPTHSGGSKGDSKPATSGSKRQDCSRSPLGGFTFDATPKKEELL